MLKLALGHGQRSLAVTQLDTSVFEMLVSESNTRKASVRFYVKGAFLHSPFIVSHCFLQLEERNFQEKNDELT